MSWSDGGRTHSAKVLLFNYIYKTTMDNTRDTCELNFLRVPLLDFTFPPARNDLLFEKILQDLLAGFGQHRFGVELHAIDGITAVP